MLNVIKKESLYLVHIHFLEDKFLPNYDETESYELWLHPFGQKNKECVIVYESHITYDTF